MNERRPSGAAGVLFLFALALGGGGLAFDLMLNQERGFWLLADPGMGAALGACAGVVVVLAGYALRTLLKHRGP
jgi:hypothetical protein